MSDRPDITDLHADFTDALFKAVVAQGPAYRKSALVRDFVSRGASRATVYRWHDAWLATGAGREALERHAGTFGKPPPTLEEKIETVKGELAPLGVDERGTIGIGPVLDQMHAVTAAAAQVLAYARSKEGDVRNPRLMLQAADGMRKSIETLLKLQDTLMSLYQVEALNEAIFEVLRRHDPRLVQEVLREFRQVHQKFQLGRAPQR